MFASLDRAVVVMVLLGVGLGACASSSAGAASQALVCAPDGSCPPGYACVYSATQGCDAPAVCVVPPDAGACAGHALCACAGGLTSDCATPGYAPVPVALPGECPALSGDAGPETRRARRRPRLLAAGLAGAALLAPAAADAQTTPSSDEGALLAVAALGIIAVGATDVSLAGYDSVRAANRNASGESYAIFEAAFGGAQAAAGGIVAPFLLHADLPDTMFSVLSLASLPFAVAMHGVWVDTTRYDGFPYAVLPVAALDASILAYDLVRLGQKHRPTGLNAVIEILGAAPQLAFGVAAAGGGRAQDVAPTLGLAALPALLVAHGVWGLTATPEDWPEASARRDEQRARWSIAVAPVTARDGRPTGIGFVGAF